MADVLQWQSPWLWQIVPNIDQLFLLIALYVWPHLKLSRLYSNTQKREQGNSQKACCMNILFRYWLLQRS